MFSAPIVMLMYAESFLLYTSPKTVLAGSVDHKGINFIIFHSQLNMKLCADTLCHTRI